MLVYLKRNLKLVKPDFSFLSKNKIKEYLFYGLFMLLSGMAGGLTTQVDKIMIAKFISLSNLGIYSIAVILSTFISLVGNSIARIAHPQISHYMFKNDFKSIEKLYKNTINFQLYFTLYIFIVLLIFSKKILLLLGKEYGTGFAVVIIVSFGELINNATGMCGGIIAFSKYYKYDFYLRILLLVINIILNYFLIKFIGIVGAAIATAFSLIVYNILKLVIVYKKFKLIPYTLNNLKIFFSNFLILIILFLLNKFFPLNLILIIGLTIIGFLIYNLILKYIFKFKENYLIEFIKSFK